ncbi:MAG: trigger factor [Helicobacteraceae bacterium]
MKIKSSKIDEANAKISAEILSSTFEATFEKITKDLAKKANIAGFRKGKVPSVLIKKRYKEQIEQDTKNDLLKQVLEGGLKDLDNKNVIGDPIALSFEKKGEIYTTEIQLGLRPAIDLGDYLAHVPSLEKISVSAKQVDERLFKIARSFATPQKTKDDAVLKSGDVAVIDFEGKIDGKAFDGGTAKNYRLEIGSGNFIAGFEDGLVGMKKGEKKEIPLTFPADYHAADLAGKASVFSVSLNDIETLDVPACDDTLAQKILPSDKEASIKKVKDLLQTELEVQERDKIFNEKLKDELTQKLLDAYKFDLPSAIVDQEINYQLNVKLRQMKEDELKALNDEKIAKLKDELRPDAQKSVKITLIIDAFSKELGVSVSDREVEQILYYEAMQMGSNPKELLDLYRSNNMIGFVKMSIIKDRVLKALVDKKNPLATKDPESKPAKTKEAKELSHGKDSKGAKDPASAGGAKSTDSAKNAASTKVGGTKKDGK